MPIAISEVPVQSIPPVPPRKRWTRKEVEIIEASGAFNQQSLELIEGDLIEKMPKNRPHSGATILLLAWCIRIFGELLVNVETAIDVAPEDNPTNQPEPDIIVFKSTYAGFWTAIPQPKDLALVVEVSDTTLAFDLSTKARLYARASIQEYWVLDLTGRRMIVHRDPSQGRYQTVEAYSDQESVAPLESPESRLRVGDVLPK